MLIGELEKILAKYQEKPRQAFDWISPALEYCRRLEAMTAESATTSEEFDQFADEFVAFVRERRLKGIFVDQYARRMAELVRRRDAA